MAASKSRYRARRNAFTLVELLVVIAIIGMLIAILLLQFIQIFLSSTFGIH